MQIIALQEYTDKYISLYEGEIRNLNKEIAERLIEQGIVRQHDSIDNGSSSDGIKYSLIPYTEGIAEKYERESSSIVLMPVEMNELPINIEDYPDALIDIKVDGQTYAYTIEQFQQKQQSGEGIGDFVRIMLSGSSIQLEDSPYAMFKSDTEGNHSIKIDVIVPKNASTSGPQIIELIVSQDAETGDINLLPYNSNDTIDKNYILKHEKDLFLINTEAGNRVFANVDLNNQNHLSALHWQELRYYSNKLSLVQYDMAIDDFPQVTVDFINIYPKEQ